MGRLAALATAFALAAACTPAGAPEPPASTLPGVSRPQPYEPEPAGHGGGGAVVGDWTFPSSLAPPVSGGPAQTALESVLFAGLLGIHPDLTWFPDLAAELPAPPGTDGILRYRLRSGLSWSDGVPITADDVIYTWQLITGPGNPNAASKAGYDAITGIDRVSDLELRIHFSRPYPSYQLLFGFLLPKHRLGGTDLSRLASDPYWARPDVVSGPFQVAEVAAGDHIAFTPNPHYPDGRGPSGHRAHLDSLVFRAYATKQALLAGMKAGEVDAPLGLAEHDLDTVAEMSGLQVKLSPVLQYEQISFNQASPNPATGAPPPWSGDPQLLYALDLALDRPSLLKGLLKGRAPEALTPLTPLLPAESDPSLVAPSFDLKKAGAVLDAEGWIRGLDGVRVRHGRRLAFVLTTTDGSQLRAHEEEIIVAGWRRAGADVQVRNVASDALFAGFPQGGVLASGRYQAAIWSWILPPDPDAEYAIFHSSQVPGAAAGSGSNYSRCSNPAIDADLAAGRAGYDPARRAAAYRDFQRQYTSSRCELPLYQHLDVTAISHRLHNHRPNPTSAGDLWNVADWWVAS